MVYRLNFASATRITTGVLLSVDYRRPRWESGFGSTATHSSIQRALFDCFRQLWCRPPYRKSGSNMPDCLQYRTFGNSDLVWSTEFQSNPPHSTIGMSRQILHLGLLDHFDFPKPKWKTRMQCTRTARGNLPRVAHMPHQVRREAVQALSSSSIHSKYLLSTECYHSFVLPQRSQPFQVLHNVCLSHMRSIEGVHRYSAELTIPYNLATTLRSIASHPIPRPVPSFEFPGAVFQPPYRMFAKRTTRLLGWHRQVCLLYTSPSPRDRQK